MFPYCVSILTVFPCDIILSTRLTVGLFVGCLTSQQHTNVFQGRFCSDNCTCCHTETEVAVQAFCLTQSQVYRHRGQPVPALTPKRQAPGTVAIGVTIYKSLVMTRSGKIPKGKARNELGFATLRADALTTKPTRPCLADGEKGG